MTYASNVDSSVGWYHRLCATVITVKKYRGNSQQTTHVHVSRYYTEWMICEMSDV